MIFKLFLYTCIACIWYLMLHDATMMCTSLTVGILITTHPQDELVNVSNNVTFTCEASGSPPINYRWLYNGNYMMDNPRHIEGANTDTLMIINVLVTDWGMYSCEATNIIDNRASNDATLHGECVILYACVLVCLCTCASV